MIQTEAVKAHLIRYGSITAKEARERYAIERLGARIYDLRKQGYSIKSVTETGKNRFGDPCKWARYFMRSEHDEP